MVEYKPRIAVSKFPNPAKVAPPPVAQVSTPPFCTIAHTTDVLKPVVSGARSASRPPSALPGGRRLQGIERAVTPPAPEPAPAPAYPAPAPGPAPLPLLSQGKTSTPTGQEKTPTPTPAPAPRSRTPRTALDVIAEVEAELGLELEPLEPEIIDLTTRRTKKRPAASALAAPSKQPKAAKAAAPSAPASTRVPRAKEAEDEEGPAMRKRAKIVHASAATGTKEDGIPVDDDVDTPAATSASACVRVPESQFQTDRHEPKPAPFSPDDSLNGLTTAELGFGPCSDTCAGAATMDLDVHGGVPDEDARVDSPELLMVPDDSDGDRISLGSFGSLMEYFGETRREREGTASPEIEIVGEVDAPPGEIRENADADAEAALEVMLGPRLVPVVPVQRSASVWPAPPAPATRSPLMTDVRPGAEWQDDNWTVALPSCRFAIPRALAQLTLTSAGP